MASAKSVTGTVVDRLARWGTASVLVGGALALPRRTRAFGVQTLMWGAIDVALALFTRQRSEIPKKRMLRHSLGEPTAADRIEAAVARAISDGARTADLGGTMTTARMGDAVLAVL